MYVIVNYKLIIVILIVKLNVMYKLILVLLVLLSVDSIVFVVCTL